MARRTLCADRQVMVSLHELGHSYRQISQLMGWSVETVRNICRHYRRLGACACQPKRCGRPSKGILSTFHSLVRWAVLKIKCQHRHWGPDVVRAELAKREWASSVRLPSASAIGVYFQQFGDRLIEPRPHRKLSQAEPTTPSVPQVHACWQMDVVEKVSLPGYGLAHLLNVVDHFSGIKIAAMLFPAQENGKERRLSWTHFRQALRQAFEKWGLPDRIRTDHDRALVAHDPSPFPLSFTLWLVGLGIEHERIRRVTQNGCVERSHWTWENRLVGYGPFPSLAEWQEIVNYELWRMNAILPSRGRHCRRQPPLVVYPQAHMPRRSYRLQDELTRFDEQQVQSYLAQGEWLRKTSQKGQLGIHDQRINLGTKFKDQWVRIVFVPQVGFQAVSRSEGLLIKTFQLKRLSAEELTGL